MPARAAERRACRWRGAGCGQRGSGAGLGAQAGDRRRAAGIGLAPALAPEIKPAASASSRQASSQGRIDCPRLGIVGAVAVARNAGSAAELPDRRQPGGRRRRWRLLARGPAGGVGRGSLSGSRERSRRAPVSTPGRRVGCGRFGRSARSRVAGVGRAGPAAGRRRLGRRVTVPLRQKFSSSRGPTVSAAGGGRCGGGSWAAPAQRRAQRRRNVAMPSASCPHPIPLFADESRSSSARAMP